MISETEYKAQDTKAQDQSFQMFMETPTVRLLISMIPPMENPDVIRTILKEAHSSGWHGGACSVSIMMVKAMMSDVTRKKG